MQISEKSFHLESGIRSRGDFKLDPIGDHRTEVHEGKDILPGECGVKIDDIRKSIGKIRQIDVGFLLEQLLVNMKIPPSAALR